MNLKKVMVFAVASTLAVSGLNGQEAAKPAEAAKPVEPPKPKFDVDALLALIPEFLGEYAVDGKVVKVDTKALKEGLRAELAMAAQQGADIKPEMIKQLLPRMGEQLVMEKVLPLEAAKKGYKANLDEVRKQIAAFKQQGSEEQFKQFLKMQGCDTEEQFVEKVAPRQAIQEYFRGIEASVKIDDKAVKEFYDANAADMKYYTCSHILVAFDPKNPRAEKVTPEQDAAALKKINEVKAKLDGGAKFEDLAKEYSDCPSKESGGMLGQYNPDTKMQPGQMVPEFTEGFNALKPGEVSAKPVKTQFGYHLIKASAVVVRKLEEVAPQIKKALKNQEMQKKIPQIMEQIKKDFQVKIYEVK